MSAKTIAASTPRRSAAPRRRAARGPEAVGGDPAPALLLRPLPGARPGRRGRRALPHPGRAGPLRARHSGRAGRNAAGPRALVSVHPTAIVDPGAVLDPSAEIGPYVVIDGPVAIGPRTRVLAGAYLTGRTEIGADNVIHPGARVGNEPQDLAYRGAETGARIGDRHVLPEHPDVNRGT